MNLKYTSVFSVFCYFFNFTLAQLILALPLFYARLVGNAGPILSIYIFVIVFIYMYIIYKLYKPFSGKNIFDISKFVGGKILYKITVFMYLSLFFIITFIFLRQISESVKILLFNTSPLIYISSFFVIAMVIRKYLWFRRNN